MTQEVTQEVIEAINLDGSTAKGGPKSCGNRRDDRSRPVAAVSRNGRTTRLFAAASLPVWIDAWRTLDEFRPTPFLTASPEWTSHWYHAFAETVDAYLAVRTRDDEPGQRPIGFWLVTLSSHRRLGPIPLRTAHVGTAGEPAEDSLFVEHNRPWLVDDDDAEAANFLDDLMELATSLPVDRVDVDGVPESIVKQSRRLVQAEKQTRISRWLDFADVPATSPREGEPPVLSLLRAKTRSNFRRAVRQYGPLQLVWEDGPAADTPLAQLIELHQSRWQAAGQGGTFSGHRVEQFYHDMLSEESSVSVAMVSDPDGPVGGCLLGENAGRIVCLVIGFADVALRPNPGLVALVLILQAAADRGAAGFEFLVGENHYKRMLSNADEQLCWAELSQPTWRMRAARSARAIKRGLDRMRGRRVPAEGHS